MYRSKIELHNIDCMEYMKTCKDNQFDLAIVDPPYGININISIGRRKGQKKSKYHKFAGKDKTIPNKFYFDQLFRISKNQIIWGGNYMTDFLKPSSCWLLWDKMFSENVSFAQFEMAWTSFEGTCKKFTKSPHSPNRIHPTEKPVDLYKWILKRYAKEGDKILDTHLGSGSISIACDAMGFDLVGCELDKEYYDDACKRLEPYRQQQKMFT